MTPFLDLSHTSHTRARTGVQRVSRALERGLRGRSLPICFDPYQGAWRTLEAWETTNLMAADPGAGRGPRWPLAARMRGYLRSILQQPELHGTAGLIVPEIFSAEVGRALPRLLAATKGPRVAVFHDAVALQYPEFTPKDTVSRFPVYLQELLQFDAVAAVSETSRTALLDYWRWLGAQRTPAVTAITLGVDPAPVGITPTASGEIPVVLCVASIEGRKNHLALLEACERLWSAGTHFHLRLIGLANSETGAAALGRIAVLKAAGRPVVYNGPESDAVLEAAYAACAFTVYPSVAEGFGLPVAESLSRGKPCVCRLQGATGEMARPGGCVDIGDAGPEGIAAALGGLLASPGALRDLAAQAQARTFKTWSQYVSEFTAWMGTLERNP